MQMDNSFQRIHTEFNHSGSLSDESALSNDLHSPRLPHKYENPSKMLIIRVNVTVENNYPKHSGIKRKLLERSAL